MSGKFDLSKARKGVKFQVLNPYSQKWEDAKIDNPDESNEEEIEILCDGCTWFLFDIESQLRMKNKARKKIDPRTGLPRDT